jgi:hypothetical protein
MYINFGRGTLLPQVTFGEEPILTVDVGMIDRFTNPGAQFRAGSMRLLYRCWRLALRGLS